MLAQAVMRGLVQELSLRQALTGVEAMAAADLEKLQSAELVLAHGLEILAFSLVSLRPTPETAKALEAEAREALLRESDQAIYARRTAAVEQERKVKETELDTERVVEEKRHQVREAAMRAEIALEEQPRRRWLPTKRPIGGSCWPWAAEAATGKGCSLSTTSSSARYVMRFGERAERQSSSGIIVSTGAGSTGWLSSVFNMAAGVSRFAGGRPGKGLQWAWEERRLAFVVREPFVSRHSSAELVAGVVEGQQELLVESMMPMSGVIFSDGVESDFLEFNSGATARIHVAGRQARLIVPAR